MACKYIYKKKHLYYSVLEKEQIFMIYLIRSMVHLTIIANELGTTSSYIAFVSTVLQDTLIKLFGEKLNVYYCMLILLIPFLFISYAVDLQKMVPCSILGNIIFCFIFMCICYYIFEDLPSISERNMYTGVTAFPGIFANLMFALECLGVVGIVKLTCL